MLTCRFHKLGISNRETMEIRYYPDPVHSIHGYVMILLLRLKIHPKCQTKRMIIS